MVIIKTKFLQRILERCPKCDGKLHHVNALDTKAKIYMVFCLNTNKRGKLTCRYCREYTLKELSKWD